MKNSISLWMVFLILVSSGCIGSESQEELELEESKSELETAKARLEAMESQQKESAETIIPTTTAPPTTTPAPTIEEQQPQQRARKNYQNVLDDLPACGDRTDFFTVPPIMMSDLMGIVPLGFIGSAPEHIYPTDHVYFHIRRDPTGHAYEVPIYAPGDMFITHVKEIRMERPVPNSTDYNIHFTPCREFEAFFFHLSTVTDRIKDQIKPPFDYCDEAGENVGRFSQKACEKDVRIEVKAGELLGTVGRLEWQYSFDMGAYDLRTEPIVYANPDRWERRTFRGIPFKMHIVCPLDYFTDDIKDELKSKLGDGYGEVLRTMEPVCGSVEQDVPGTSQGTWETNKFESWGPQLSLMHDFVDPTKGAFAVGTAAEDNGIPTNIYYFAPTRSGSVNLDFDLVKDDEIYCYENFVDERLERQSIIILVQLTSPNTLLIEGQQRSRCGDGPWEFTNPAEFER